MNKSRIHPRAEKVFVGIDVHKKVYALCAVKERGILWRCQTPASWELVLSVLKKRLLGQEVEVVYEAGFSGFGLCRFLNKNGIRTIVVNAASVEIAANDKVKTDKRDATKLALQLAAGTLKPIRIPSKEQEHRRLLTRTREQLRKDRARCMNRIRMKLHQFGLIGPGEWQRLSYRRVEQVLAEKIAPELRLSIETLLSLWKLTSLQIRTLEKELCVQEKKDPNTSVYRSFPGIGLIHSRTLANELGNLMQFPNERAVFSFTGLTPQEYSSGGRRYTGHISRQGSSRLRHTLVEVAWRAITKDPQLRKDFERIAVRAGKKRAIVAIARKLIGHIRAAFRAGTVYEMKTAA